jgi:prepilin-type N-terminal cleavage/methylation domain-containing protein/prepilin-type processing-associated H-X9-DG protein
MLKTSVKTRSAFTLIELLVVIAIIAILAAILFPVFGRARENARRSSCLSNMKQLGLGMMQYIQDYDETFPHAFWNVDNSVNGYQDQANERGWSYNIQPYIKSVQVFQCPSDLVAPPNYSLLSDTAGQHYLAYTDYCYNRAMGNPAGVNAPTVKLARLTMASNTVMFTEMTGGPSGTSAGGGPGGGFTTTPGLAIGRVDSAIGYGAMQRHLDGSNIAFGDGHVKWYKGSSHNTYANVYNNATPVTASTVSFSLD